MDCCRNNAAPDLPVHRSVILAANIYSLVKHSDRADREIGTIDRLSAGGFVCIDQDARRFLQNGRIQVDHARRAQRLELAFRLSEFLAPVDLVQANGVLLSLRRELRRQGLQFL